MKAIVDLVVTTPDRLSKNDDWVDRLSRRYTVFFLAVCAIIVTGALWIGKAITCWVPKHFTGSHEAYANAYCWVKNTYFLPFEEHIPEAHEEEKRHTILYYQWMPFILLGQALLFYLPSTVWESLNVRAGVDFDSIMETATKLSRVDQSAESEKILKYVTQQIERFLGARKISEEGEKSRSTKKKVKCPGLCGRRNGAYLIILYIFVKLLYITNIVLQLIILNGLLRTTFAVYGVEFLRNAWIDDHWVHSKTFPRVTMCDFYARRIGNVQRYTVQCVLPINMYTEKIYAFLWFWFFFVLVMSIQNTLVWLSRFIFRSDRIKYVHNHLRRANILKDVPHTTEDVTKFTREYLQQDGVFVLRMIGHNTNNVTVTDVIETLYRNWYERELKKAGASPHEDKENPSLYPALLPK